MSTATEARPTRAILRHLGGQLPDTVVLWCFFVIAVAGLAFLIDTFGTISSSVWEGASQLPRWFAVAIGVYLTAVYLPLYIAHGHTRREFGAQAALFVVAFATVLAALMTAGYGIESVAYRLLGWPQALSQTHLFDAPDQFGLILVEFWLVFLVATLAGAMVAAGFYRHGGLGMALLPLGLILLGATEVIVIRSIVPWFLPDVLAGRSLPAVVGICSGAVAVSLALTWAVIRDTPVRSKNA